MKVKVTKSELLECIENAVNKVVNEGIDEIQGGKDRRHGFSRGEMEAPRRPKMKPNNKGFKGNKGNQNWAQDDDLEQVAESRVPRRKK